MGDTVGANTGAENKSIDVRIPVYDSGGGMWHEHTVPKGTVLPESLFMPESVFVKVGEYPPGNTYDLRRVVFRHLSGVIGYCYVARGGAQEPSAGRVFRDCLMVEQLTALHGDLVLAGV